MKTLHTVLLMTGFFLITSCSDKVKEVKLQHKDITEMVFAPGVLEAYDQYNLTAQTDGYLVSMQFEEGALVSKGQLMAVIDNDQNIINAQSATQLHVIASQNAQSSAPALQEIRVNIEAAASKAKLDAQQLERYSRLYENNSVSRNEYDEARLTLTNSKASLRSLEEQYQKAKSDALQQEIVQRYASKVNSVLQSQNKLTAIQAGKVYKKEKQLGDYVRKGDVIAIIGSPDVIYAKLNVDEANMSRVKPGQKVTVQLNTDKDKTYQAVVRQILPAFDEDTRSFIVKAYFAQKPDFDITGTQLEANIVIRTKKDALVIPSVYLEYGNKVMLKKDEQVVTVKPGIVSSEWIEILSGLDARQSIITKQP